MGVVTAAGIAVGLTEQALRSPKRSPLPKTPATPEKVPVVAETSSTCDVLGVGVATAAGIAVGLTEKALRSPRTPQKVTPGAAPVVAIPPATCKVDPATAKVQWRRCSGRAQAPLLAADAGTS